MCTHDNIKIIPTNENSWGIEDTYDVKCMDCGKVILAGRSMEEIEQMGYEGTTKMIYTDLQ